MAQATPPNPPDRTQDLDSWKPYDLDHHAQELVIKNSTKKDVLNESHKMRMTIAYGLERFWGERFRLEENKDPDEANYWKDVWQKVANILEEANITLPNDDIKSQKTDPKEKEKEEAEKIQAMAHRIWDMDREDREIALMVLTQFCDSLVWWTQRYKKKTESEKSSPIKNI